MKRQVTNAFIKSYSKKIFLADENIMQFKTADYYNCGVYGWNYDAWHVNNNTVILGGYRINKSCIDKTIGYETCKKYEKIANLLHKKYILTNRELFNKKYNQLINRLITQKN
jgi:hypothetical protein